MDMIKTQRATDLVAPQKDARNAETGKSTSVHVNGMMANCEIPTLELVPMVKYKTSPVTAPVVTFHKIKSEPKHMNDMMVNCEIPTYELVPVIVPITFPKIKCEPEVDSHDVHEIKGELIADATAAEDDFNKSIRMQIPGNVEIEKGNYNNISLGELDAYGHKRTNTGGERKRPSRWHYGPFGVCHHNVVTN